MPDFETAVPSSSSFGETVKSFRYVSAKPDSGWALPADEDYDGSSAALAHSRSLAFLKPLLGGPYFDLEAVWEEHCQFEFLERDVEKTMATMVDRPYVNHIPTMTYVIPFPSSFRGILILCLSGSFLLIQNLRRGGIGKERLTAFYATHFIFSNSPDTTLGLVSRTVGTDRIVDEFVFKTTHDREVEWLYVPLPLFSSPSFRHH